MTESRLKRVGDLDIEQDLDFERTEWRVERLAWVVLAAIVLATLAGLFGNGPLSRTQARTADGKVEVRYQRFVRNGSTGTVQVEVQPGSAEDDQVRLWLSNDYLDDLEIEQVTPEPSSQEARDDGVVSVFDVPGGTSPLDVTFGVRFDGVGRLEGEVGLDGAPRVSLSQFAYP